MQSAIPFELVRMLCYENFVFLLLSRSYLAFDSSLLGRYAYILVFASTSADCNSICWAFAFVRRKQILNVYKTDTKQMQNKNVEIGFDNGNSVATFIFLLSCRNQGPDPILEVTDE